MPRERKTLEEHALQSTRPQYVLPDSEVVANRLKLVADAVGIRRTQIIEIV